MNDDGKKPVPPAPDDLKKVDGSGKVEPAGDILERACTVAADAGNAVAAILPSDTSRRDRMRAVRAFKSPLVPSKKPGRKPRELVTCAHATWKQGLRGTQLYIQFIPNGSKMGRWRRKAAQRALMDAIYSRERRAKERSRTRPDPQP